MVLPSARGAVSLAALGILILAGAAASAQSELVIVRKGAKEYHRPGCEVVRDAKDVIALTKAQAESRGLTPHDACDPANAPSASPDGKPATPEPPVYVYTDGSNYYHREACKKLGKDAKKVVLEEAGKELWPCPTCRPPIRKRKGGASPPLPPTEGIRPGASRPGLVSFGQRAAAR